MQIVRSDRISRAEKRQNRAKRVVAFIGVRKRYCIIRKTNEKNKEKMLTKEERRGILTKLFDGAEVQRSGTKRFEKIEKSA